MSWVAAALLAALCAGITSILAKCGVRDTDPISPRVYEPLLCSFSHGSWYSSLMRKLE